MGKIVVISATMKEHLVVFDFDKTIKSVSWFTMGVSHLFPGKELPQELCSLWGSGEFYQAVFEKVNELGVTKEAIVDSYANDGFLIEQMDEVVKTFYKDHDVIIVSDNSIPLIEAWMKKHELYQYLENIFARPNDLNNGQITEKDKPSEWFTGQPCDLGSKYCKADIVKFFKKNKNYKTTTYIGDGKNDLCPSLDLKKEDRVFARMGHPLHSLLTNGQHDVKATVTSWENGKDILAAL